MPGGPVADVRSTPDNPAPPAAASPEGGRSPQPTRFRPAGQHDLAPSGEVERIRANLDAVRALSRQRQEQRSATAGEQALYARWSGWGATPALFDERPKYAGRFAAERAELRALLGEDGYRTARATTLNAHYTDAAYVRVIWDAVTRLGFSGGSVLEPGCGSGNFFGFAPSGARLVGVEVDPTTAQIAQALYPDAEIRAESFADTRLPVPGFDPGFDLVIGNVPFGSHKLHDPRYNPGRENSIHNHFILKSLHATRPGGLVALITSRYTMDGVDAAHQRAREQMADLADLLGAVRLPTDAHQAAAGTDVVTDLLVFRRRPAGQAAVATVPRWLRARPVELAAAREPATADSFEVNEYFLEHPEMVLGEVTGGGRGRPVLAVRASHTDTAAALRAALDRLVPKPQVVLRGPEPALQEGLFIDEGDGRFSQVRDGQRVRHEPPRTQIGELRALIALREAVLALLDEETTHRDDTPRMAALRQQLNTRYGTYTARYGAINRLQRTTRTRVDKETGEVVETERRTNPRMGGFRDDPFFPYVAALEKFDDESGQVDKAEIFTRRVIAVPDPVRRVATPADALVVCWDRHNEVRLDVIASLLGLDDPSRARQALDDLVYDEPGTGALIRKAEYLSGNVRRKLAAARAAAETDPRFEANVRALRAVVPRDLTPAEISARLGSPWIDARHVQQFLRDILEDDGVTVTNTGARWSVHGGDRKGVLATTVWGTKARPATDLADNLLNSQTIEITKTVGTGADKKTVRDTEATAFAQAKAQQLDERFRAWLWEDPDRATALGRTYNDRFNARVPRSYEGEHIEAPGMSAAFRLHPHQMAAVARIRDTPGVGLFHGTGAGKTLEMIVGGMELVRLGLVRKPCYVVPKGVLGQFRREFLQAYPRAKVLAADSEDLQGDKRRRFVARCSTGDWDAIIISHTAFKKIPVSRTVRVDYLNKQLDRLRQHLANSEGADRYTVKDIEKQVATLQEQIAEQLASPSDPGVEFERTGIGYLFIDEAHVYKNLRVISCIPELAHNGNQITADLEMKLEYLRRTGRRVVTLATATPIDNSPSEILTMTKYAAPDLLAEMGVEEDDQYHAAFIQPRRRVEMRPDGSGFESRTRHTRYVNLPEQKQLMYSWADVKLKEHLDLGEPAIVGGQPEVLAVPASAQLRQHLVTLAVRARQVTGGHPDQRLTTNGELKDDNILWISTDGRTASLDLRLAGDHTDEPQKIDVAADRLAEIWRQHRDDVYYRPDGTAEPVRGSLQLVFCDLGVPRRGRWSAYQGLRDELVARGMPADQIRFAQDAKTRRGKDQLDADARDGKISVLIGSRQGLGTGRNIQRRVVTVLQLDPTWKLTPVTQSLGRGQRQGNDNDAIHHIFVVTENSYDPFLWQKVDDKARFTRQMLDPNDTTRIIDAQDDDNAGQIDPAVMFAVAAGRPELLELHRTEETVGALRLEARIWGDEQFTLKATVEQNRRAITGLRRAVTGLDATLARRRDTGGDAFRMTLDGSTFDNRADAGAALVQRLHVAVHADQGRQRLQLGVLGGLTLSAGIEPGLLGDRALLSLDGLPDSTIELIQHDLDALTTGSSQDRVGLVRKLENRLAAADDLRQRYLDSIDRLQINIDRAGARIGLPFPRQADLDRYTRQLADLHQRLRILDTASPHHTPDADGPQQTPDTAQDAHHTPDADRPQQTPDTDGPQQTSDTAQDTHRRSGHGQHPPAASVRQDPNAHDPPTARATTAADQLAAPGPTIPDPPATPSSTVPDPSATPTSVAGSPVAPAHAAEPAGGDLPPPTEAGATAGTLHDAPVHSDLPAGRTPAQTVTGFDPAGGADTRPVPADGSAPDAIAGQTRRSTTAAGEPSPLPETQRVRRGHPFYPPADILAAIPRLYGTDRQPPEDTMLHLHYFGGAHDIWLAEYDPDTGEGFGYVNLGDPDYAEWGYVSLPELEKINHGLVIIERDLYWTPVPASQAKLPGRRAPRPVPEPPPPAVPAAPTTDIGPPAPETVSAQTTAVQADGIPDAHEPAPQPAWLEGVLLDEETPTVDGRHRVRRRTNRRGTTVYVEARHPQVGMLPRGRTDLTSDGAGAGTGGGAPAPTWQIIDYDGTLVGEHVGAYLDAETRLLAATTALDEPLTDHEVAELTVDPETDQPAEDVPGDGTDVGTATSGIPSALVEAADASPPPRDAYPVGEGGVAEAVPAAAAATAEANAPADNSPARSSWTDRIEIVDGPNLLVRGTTGAPREEGLRGLLKQYRFRYQRARGEWRYAGRLADRAAAIGDIRRWLDAQSSADVARGDRPVSMLPPTGQQQRILDAFAAGQTVAVQALAGTGKTSTLLMLAAARPEARIAYIAFNRSIADEAQRKFSRNVRADTSHAFAREGLSGSPLRPKLARVGQGLRWPQDWAAHLGITAIDHDEQAVEPEIIARMTMATVRTFRESSADAITAAHLPKSLPDGIPGLAEAVLRHAQAAWADISDPAGELLFDHDDYLKLWALDNPRLPADVVFFDEAQDINDVLRKVIQQQPQQTVVVGDSHQSIYGFRGAIDALKHWPAQSTLPLTQSWRFGPEVAAVGNQFLRLLRSSWLLTGNPAIASTIGPVGQPDAVLARTNAGAVAAVFDAVDAGRTVALMGGGRAIQEIAQAAKDLQAGRRTKHPELSRFADWDEVRAFCEDDDAPSLRAFVRLVDRRGADGLLRMVHELRDEDATDADGSPAYDVIVSTVHKSKGREWDHVRVADDFPQPKQNLTTRQVTLPGDEELRLAYVAVTRAKRSLELGSLSWIEDFAPDPALHHSPAAAEQTTRRSSPATDADTDHEPDPAATPTAEVPDDEPAEKQREDGPHAEHAAPQPQPALQPAVSAQPAAETSHDGGAEPFNAVEQAMIRNAVADHAPGYYGGPLGPGRDSAARYTSEGHLKELVAVHGLGKVWEAVAAIIAADPSVLERNHRQRTDDRVARQARAEHLADQALAACKARDYDAAHRLINDAELVDPEYRPGSTQLHAHGMSWAGIRQTIERFRVDYPPPDQHDMDQWLATQPQHLRDGLPATARRWLEQQIIALAADPTVIRAAATAHDPNDLANVVDQRLFDQVNRTEGWQLPEDRTGQFFTCYLDQPAVRDALHAFARHAVLRAIRANTTPEHSAPDTSVVTAAHLARLDTAPGTTTGAHTPTCTVTLRDSRATHSTANYLNGKQDTFPTRNG